MGRVNVEVELANNEDLVRAKDGTLAEDKVRRARVPGIVDTGASYLVLPKSVAAQLGVPSAGKATVRYDDRRKAKRSVVENVRVELLGRHGSFKAIVEPNRDDVLIGAIVLEDLDLLVDCRTQKLHPRDPDGIIAEIE
jgi:predicted aspartyl protease